MGGIRISTDQCYDGVRSNNIIITRVCVCVKFTEKSIKKVYDPMLLSLRGAEVVVQFPETKPCITLQH